MDSAVISPLLVFLFAIIGACLGSFSTALGYRVAAGKPWFVELTNDGVLPSRSCCPSCYHGLTARDLIPIVSWCVLRGRCRHCGAGIPVSYPLAEIAAMLITTGLACVYGMQWFLLPLILSVPFLLSIVQTNVRTGKSFITLSVAVFLCGILFSGLHAGAGGHIAAAIILPAVMAIAGVVSFGFAAVKAGLKTDGVFLLGAGLFTGLQGLPLFLLIAAPLIVLGAIFCGITKRKSLDFLPSIYAATLILHIFLTGIGFDGRAVGLLTAG